MDEDTLSLLANGNKFPQNDETHYFSACYATPVTDRRGRRPRAYSRGQSVRSIGKGQVSENARNNRNEWPACLRGNINRTDIRADTFRMLNDVTRQMLADPI